MGDELAIPDGLIWQYQMIIRAGHLSHCWSIKGDRGGIHVNAWWSDFGGRSDHWIGGVEGHSPVPQEYSPDSPPSQEHCWLLEKPCWHDGSSLQFSEQIAPYLPHENRAMGWPEHRDVLAVMLSRYRSWLPELSTTPTQGSE